MITQFEYETASLTEEELRIAEIIARRIRHNIGKGNIVTSQRIIEVLKAEGIELEGSRFRKIINYIRMNKVVKNLVATSRGYYIETDREKVREYVEGLFKRSEAILAVAKSYEI